jgi:eukaryotic-like serine/threonine-protein kinase
MDPAHSPSLDYARPSAGLRSGRTDEAEPGPAGRRLSTRPMRLAALAALIPTLALAVLVVPRSDAALSAEVAARVSRGDLAGARALIDRAERRRPGDPVVEKLRGDVACARGAAGDCLRHYRVSLAARPALRDDAVLRANARRLLASAPSCSGRRAAAELLGELRDPASLPVLEQARRSAGPFAFFCTGDAIDRAIVATRAGARRR